MRRWRTDDLQGVALHFLTSGVPETRGFLDQVDYSLSLFDQVPKSSRRVVQFIAP